MIGNRLRYLREKNGYTQRKIAEHLNIDRSTYSYYETGKTRPDIETLKKLSKLFHVSIDYLAGNVTVLRSNGADYTMRPTAGMLTEMEENMIQLYRDLSEENKEKVGAMVIQLLTKERKV